MRPIPLQEFRWRPRGHGMPRRRNVLFTHGRCARWWAETHAKRSWKSRCSVAPLSKHAGSCTALRARTHRSRDESCKHLKKKSICVFLGCWGVGCSYDLPWPTCVNMSPQKRECSMVRSGHPNSTPAHGEPQRRPFHTLHVLCRGPSGVCMGCLPLKQSHLRTLHFSLSLQAVSAAELFTAAHADTGYRCRYQCRCHAHADVKCVDEATIQTFLRARRPLRRQLLNVDAYGGPGRKGLNTLGIR